MADAPHAETTFWEIYSAVLRHRRKAVQFFLIVVATVVLGTLLWPKTYRSEAKLHLRLGRENVTLDPTVMAGRDSVLAIPQSRENEINSVAEVLKSQALAEQVVDAIGSGAILGSSDWSPDGPKADSSDSAESGGLFRWLGSLVSTPLSDRDRAVREVIKRLSVTPVRKSDIILVSYEGPSPELAQAVAAEFCDSYLEQHVHLNRSARAHSFLARETDRLHEKLTRAEEALCNLKNEAGLASREGQRQIMATRIGRIEDDLLKTTAGAAASEAKVRRLQEALTGLPEVLIVGETTGVANEGTDGMREQFFALKVREQELASRLTESHPLLQEIRRQAEAAGALLDREEPTRTQVTMGPGRAHEEIELALLREEPLLTAMRCEADSLQQQLADARDELKTLNAKDLQIAGIEREIQLHEANYMKYSANLEQARIDEALEDQRISNITVVQPATCDRKPVRPNKAKNLILGLLAGLFGGLGVALAADYKDRSSMPPQNVEAKLGLPALVTLPQLEPSQLKLSKHRVEQN